MTTDVLSDVLKAVRLTGAVYFDFELSSPWVAAAPPSNELAGKVLPGAERLVMYHLIARGSCWAEPAGQGPMRLAEGDLIIFPQGDGHIMSSEPGMRAEPDLAPYAIRSTPLPLAFELGGGGSDRARVVCGFLGCDDRPYNPLIAALPAVIHLTSAASSNLGWLSQLVSIAASESTGARAGSGNVLARVSELMFVEAIRQHLETVPPTRRGWLASLRDPVVGQALSALHAKPADTWTIERLARLVGQSRSLFAERFTDMVGQPPMQYLALWRMQLASRLLSEGQAVANVASEVGYESEAAFSRAFKKLVGQPPGTWRRRNSSINTSSSSTPSIET